MTSRFAANGTEVQPNRPTERGPEGLPLCGSHKQLKVRVCCTGELPVYRNSRIGSEARSNSQVRAGVWGRGNRDREWEAAGAVIHALVPPRRSISECIALPPEDSTATIDPDFARDVEAAVESHREPLEPPAFGTNPRFQCAGHSLGYSVATGNLRHFQMISGLSVVRF
jgi:hypothetical protein